MVNNKWMHGDVQLVIPALPLSYIGQTAACLFTASFDDAIKTEVYFAILEDSSYISEYGGLKLIDLHCKTMFVPTAYGCVIVLITSISASGVEKGFYEVFLDPHHPDTLQLLSIFSEQAYVKALTINSDTSDVVNWFELENNYGFEQLVEALPGVIKGDTPVNFSLAQQEVMQTYTVDQLRAMG